MLSISVHCDQPVTMTDAHRTIQLVREPRAGRPLVNLPAPKPGDFILLYLGGVPYRLDGKRLRHPEGICLGFDVADDCQVTREAARL